MKVFIIHKFIPFNSEKQNKSAKSCYLTLSSHDGMELADNYKQAASASHLSAFIR